MLEKRSLGTLKRTNSEDSLNERFKERKMQKKIIIKLKCPNCKKNSCMEVGHYKLIDKEEFEIE